MWLRRTSCACQQCKKRNNNFAEQNVRWRCNQAMSTHVAAFNNVKLASLSSWIRTQTNKQTNSFTTGIFINQWLLHTQRLNFYTNSCCVLNVLAQVAQTNVVTAYNHIKHHSYWCTTLVTCVSITNGTTPCNSTYQFTQLYKHANAK